MALTVAAASAQAMGAALATDGIPVARSTTPLIRLSDSPETEIEAAESIEVWR